MDLDSVVSLVWGVKIRQLCLKLIHSIYTVPRTSCPPSKYISPVQTLPEIPSKPRYEDIISAPDIRGFGDPRMGKRLAALRMEYIQSGLRI